MSNALDRDRHHALGREAVGEDRPRRVDAAQVDASRLAFQERADLADRDAGGPQAEQVLQRQRVAALLQRQHHLARPVIDHVRGEIGDIGARCRADYGGHWLAHVDKVRDGEFGAPLRRQRADPRRARAGAQHDHAMLEHLCAERPAQQRAGTDQQHGGHDHRVEEVRSPRGEREHGEVDYPQEDHAQRHRHRQSRRREAQREKGGDAVRANRDQRQLQRGREGQQLQQPLGGGSRCGADLDDADLPADLGGGEQRDRIDQAEQQYDVRHVMLEQPHHGRNGPGWLRC